MDGCSSECQVEDHWKCENGGLGVKSDCSEICGDGVVMKPKDGYCDDNNTDNEDGCDEFCNVEAYWECTLGSDTEKSECSDI